MEKPIIDWALGEKLVGGDPSLAKEVMKDLLHDLPGHLEIIQAAYLIKDLESLRSATHHLHGALCYCGAPRLKEAAYNLEHAIHSGKGEAIDLLFQQLMNEALALQKLLKQ